MVRLREEDLVTRNLWQILTSVKKWKRSKKTRWSLLSLFTCMSIFSHVWKSTHRHMACGYSWNDCHDMCSLRYHSHDRSLHGILQYQHLHWCVHIREQSPVIRLTWYLMVYLQTHRCMQYLQGFYDYGSLSTNTYIYAYKWHMTPCKYLVWEITMIWPCKRCYGSANQESTRSEQTIYRNTHESSSEWTMWL